MTLTTFPDNTVSNPLAVSHGGSGASTAQGAMDNLLPDQSGKSGYVLQSDGTHAAWTNTVGGVKKYVALLTQSGTSAPVATVLENTLGGTVVWTRNDAGDYTGTLASAFTADKTVLLLGSPTPQSLVATGMLLWSSANALSLQTFASDGDTGDLTDDMLVNTTVEIRVYP